MVWREKNIQTKHQKKNLLDLIQVPKKFSSTFFVEINFHFLSNWNKRNYLPIVFMTKLACAPYLPSSIRTPFIIQTKKKKVIPVFNFTKFFTARSHNRGQFHQHFTLGIKHNNRSFDKTTSVTNEFVIVFRSQMMHLLYNIYGYNDVMVITNKFS
jgi:hypothetical protein